MIDPANGDILVATGNAPWDGQTNWGDASLRLSPDATKLLGNFTPSNTDQLNAQDLDMGSTSPVLLSEGYIAQGGKDGNIRLLSVARIARAAAHKGGEVAGRLDAVRDGSLHGAGGVAQASATWMFAADNGGTAAWRFSGGQLDPGLAATARAAPARSSPAGCSACTRRGGGLNVYVPADRQARRDARLRRRPLEQPDRRGRPASRFPRGTRTTTRRTGVLDIWSR